mmetsp:Transcript_19309/g.64733  ORF Transcript_19309/g.64733 Transcript_19309/m.64733 type:complete len:218 (+) Transcript_19309:274-927(+)
MPPISPAPYLQAKACPMVPVARPITLRALLLERGADQPKPGDEYEPRGKVAHDEYGEHHVCEDVDEEPPQGVLLHGDAALVDELLVVAGHLARDALLVVLVRRALAARGAHAPAQAAGVGGAELLGRLVEALHVAAVHQDAVHAIVDEVRPRALVHDARQSAGHPLEGHVPKGLHGGREEEEVRGRVELAQLLRGDPPADGEVGLALLGEAAQLVGP